MRKLWALACVAMVACGGEGDEANAPDADADVDNTEGSDSTDTTGSESAQDTGATTDTDSSTTGTSGTEESTVCAYVLRDGVPSQQLTYTADGRLLEELMLSSAGGVAQTMRTTYEEDEPWKISTVYLSIFPGPPQETPSTWDWRWSGTEASILRDGNLEELRSYRDDGALLLQQQLDDAGQVEEQAEWEYQDDASWKVVRFVDDGDTYLVSWSGDESTLTFDGVEIQRAGYRSDGTLLSIERLEDDGSVSSTTTFRYLSDTSWQLSETITTTSSGTSVWSYDWQGCN